MTKHQRRPTKNFEHFSLWAAKEKSSLRNDYDSLVKYLGPVTGGSSYFTLSKHDELRSRCDRFIRSLSDVCPLYPPYPRYQILKVAEAAILDFQNVDIIPLYPTNSNQTTKHGPVMYCSSRSTAGVYILVLMIGMVDECDMRVASIEGEEGGYGCPKLCGERGLLDAQLPEPAEPVEVLSLQKEDISGDGDKAILRSAGRKSLRRKTKTRR